MRRLGIVRQEVQHFQSFLLTVLLDAMSEHDFVAGLVHARLEAEVPTFIRLLQRPTGEHLGNLGDIFLRVAAVYAESVQLQQLAAVVFVQAAGMLVLPPRSRRTIIQTAPITALVRRDAERDVRVRPDAQPVVEIEQHRRALRGRHQQVFELPQHMRADRVALVAGHQVTVGSLVDEHVEVVEPEVRHHFVELPFAIDRAQQLGLHQLIDHHLLGIIERHHCLFLPRAHSCHEGTCLGAFGCGGDRPPIFGRHFQNFLHALVGRQIEKFLRLDTSEPAFFAAARLVGIGGLVVFAGDGASPVSTRVADGCAARDGGGIAFGSFFLAFLLVFVTLELCFVHRAHGGIVRQRGFPVGDLLDQLIGRKILDDLFRVHTQRTERTEPGLERRVINFIGMKLEFDPLVNAHLGDPLHVAGPRTERQPVQGVDGALLGVHPHRRSGGLVFLAAESELRRKPGRCKQHSRHQQTASAQRHFHPDWPR